MFLSSVDDLIRILIVTPLAYVGAVAIIRISGKRALSKLNAFDLIVSVALGSILASIITSSNTDLIPALTGFALLLLLQVCVTWATSRREVGTTVVRSDPALLVEHGRIRNDVLEKMRLTEAEVRQAVRAQGIGGLDQVAAVCFESDGTLSVIPEDSLGDGSALTPVPDWDGSSR